MTPQAYWDALRSLAALNFQSEAWLRMTAHLRDWNGLSDIYRLPLFAVAVYAFLRPRTSPILRVIAGAALAQQVVLFFYNPGGRYAYMAWMLCFFVFVAVLREEIVPAVRRRLPHLRRDETLHAPRENVDARAR